MSLETDIEKLKRIHKRGPMSQAERLEAIQAAYRSGMRGAALNELDYSLMSPEEREENDRIWAEIRLPQRQLSVSESWNPAGP
jgi:hypothetical protein